MSRPLQIQFPEAVYHVMNRGAARQPTFTDEGDYQAFLDTLAEAHRLWGIEVFAYSLIGTHYHLCLRTPKGNLSRVMRHVDGIYTQRFNRRHRRDGTLFRGRYKAILIDADEYLAEAVEQIGGRQAFHEFVLSGNEESLKQYYEAQRQSPILGSEEFIERVR